MATSFNLTKTLKSLSKVDGIFVGSYDPHTWLSTGNYSLNYFMAQDFKKAIPFGKVVVLAGAPGAGKSYISASAAREAQAQGITVVFIDTEGALDDKWLTDVGIDTKNNFLRIECHMIGDLARTMEAFIQQYKEDNAGKSAQDKQKLLFIVDSLGMLSTPNAVEQFRDGDLKGDMGHKPKQLKALVTQFISYITGEEICVIMTNHTYENQDKYKASDAHGQKMSGGAGPIYAASIIIGMKKTNLKESEKKDAKSVGIKATCYIIKSRYAKPHETVEIDIPYDSGLDPYSGLFDLFLKKNAIIKNGNRYKYTALDGKEYNEYKKDYSPELYHLIMDEWEQQEDKRYGSAKINSDGEDEETNFDPETGEVFE